MNYEKKAPVPILLSSLPSTSPFFDTKPSISSSEGTLLNNAEIQWQFGDWESLAKLHPAVLHDHPERVKLALMAIVGKFQIGEVEDAKTCIHMVQKWGVNPKLIIQILISGIYNSLGRTVAIGHQPRQSLKYFANAVTVTTREQENKLIIRARTWEQLRQLKLIDTFQIYESEICSEYSGDNYADHRSSIDNNENYLSGFSSSQYWDERYLNGGTSGHGSYGRLAEFKAKVINKFIKDENITCVIEFGCGDGNQLSKINAPSYVGVDISATVINKCKERFIGDVTKKFLTNAEYLANPGKCDLSLSLDVIFHLVEDNIFESYMAMLFDATNRYCIIYSCDEDMMKKDAIHVRRRKFTEWVSNNRKNWRLMQVIYNKFPHDGSHNPKNSSFSNFYFFEQVGK